VSCATAVVAKKRIELPARAAANFFSIQSSQSAATLQFLAVVDAAKNVFQLSRSKKPEVSRAVVSSLEAQKLLH
jgi:hypothetical protein